MMKMMMKEKKIMDEDMYFMKRGSWFSQDFGSSGYELPWERHMGKEEYRSFTAFVTDDDYPVWLLEELFSRVMSTIHDVQSSWEGASVAMAHIFVTGMFEVARREGIENVDELESVVKLYKSTSPKKKPRWRSKFYPVLVKGKASTICEIESDICEISNQTQWSPDRIIKEAFIYGLGKLKTNITKEWIREVGGRLSGRAVWIYGLLDPRDHEVHYVGKSKHPIVRWKQHIDDGIDTPKTSWLQELAKNDQVPDIRILEQTTDSNANDAEDKWIDYLLSTGSPLTNSK